MAYATSDQIIERRAASVWTKIHPLFAIAQLVTFLISVVLLVQYFRGGVGYHTVHLSVLIKVALMLGASVTGALWEKDVFGKYWFAPEFLGEDVMTVNVFILHFAYLVMAYTHPDQVRLVVGTLMLAYGVYSVNVLQYVLRTAHMTKKTKTPKLPKNPSSPGTPVGSHLAAAQPLPVRVRA
ncbi:MAG: hypothetical protein NVS2B17_09790 [Candidatus Velthaea sp.]